MTLRRITFLSCHVILLCVLYISIYNIFTDKLNSNQDSDTALKQLTWKNKLLFKSLENDGQVNSINNAESGIDIVLSESVSTLSDKLSQNENNVHNQDQQRLQNFDKHSGEVKDLIKNFEIKKDHFENADKRTENNNKQSSHLLKRYFGEHQNEHRVENHEVQVNDLDKVGQKPLLPVENPKAKIILWYVKARYINPTPTPKILSNCPDKCMLTTNQDLHNVSSALLFSGIILNGPVPKRYEDQVFVLHNHEPQCAFSRNSPLFKDEWKSQFNWTMWYREDSDIHEPYGLIVKNDNVSNKDYRNIFRSKSKMAAVMVSNCGGQARRMPYIKKLMEYGVDIDIYGNCGKFSCERGKDEECRSNINRNYKFYLSFESSLCPDYVTEKFFHPYQGDIITVARGGADYSKIVPEGTFINTKHYKSVKDLADYMIQLARNEEEYISILRKKNGYKSLDEPYPHINSQGQATYFTYHYEEKPMCELCHRLWNLDDYKKTIPNITTWFNMKSCQPPNDLD